MRFLFNPIIYALLLFSLFLSGLGAMGFLGPDEPRYAAVAREMMRSGDYVTPRLFGTPWFEKPPLYYWSAALLFRQGANEVTARLPSALAAIAFLGAWFWFVRRRFGTPTARLACMVLASTVGWISLARAATMDMLLAATLDAALIFLACWFWEERPSQLYAFYGLLALATLAKGPVAVALAGMIALGYIANFRQWAALKKLLYTPALGLFFAVAAPWYLLCYARHGSPFLEEFFFRHNVERFLSPAIGHPQPFWYYLPILVAGLFPWSALLALPLLDGIRGGLRRLLADRERAFLFYWTVLPLVFFSLSHNKLPGYLLPLLPPLTLWAVRDWGAAAEDSRTIADDPKAAAAKPSRKLLSWLLGISTVSLLFIPVVAPLLPESLAGGLRRGLAGWSAAAWSQILNGPAPATLWVILLGLVILGLYQVGHQEWLDGALAVLLGMVLLVFAVNTYFSPSINRLASARTVARRIQLLGVRPEAVAVYRIHRNQRWQLSFYLDHDLPEWTPEAKGSPVSLVVAQQEEPIAKAWPVSFFPGQQIRLWTLREGDPSGIIWVPLRP